MKFENLSNTELATLIDEWVKKRAARPGADEEAAYRLYKAGRTRGRILAIRPAHRINSSEKYQNYQRKNRIVHLSPAFTAGDFLFYTKHNYHFCASIQNITIIVINFKKPIDISPLW